jgi:hypothetical protein
MIGLETLIFAIVQAFHRLVGPRPAGRFCTHAGNYTISPLMIL